MIYDPAETSCRLGTQSTDVGVRRYRRQLSQVIATRSATINLSRTRNVYNKESLDSKGLYLSSHVPRIKHTPTTTTIGQSHPRTERFNLNDLSKKHNKQHHNPPEMPLSNAQRCQICGDVLFHDDFFSDPSQHFCLSVDGPAMMQSHPDDRDIVSCNHL